MARGIFLWPIKSIDQKKWSISYKYIRCIKKQSLNWLELQSVHLTHADTRLIDQRLLSKWMLIEKSLTMATHVSINQTEGGNKWFVIDLVDQRSN